MDNTRTTTMLDQDVGHPDMATEMASPNQGQGLKMELPPMEPAMEPAATAGASAEVTNVNDETQQRQSRMRALMGKMGHGLSNVLGHAINGAKEIFRPTKRKGMVVGSLGLVAASGAAIRKARS